MNSFTENSLRYLERTKFPEGVLKFDGWSGCEVVFKNEGVTIYELLDENA
ncbi:MAG: hypothetical protein OCU18_01375 [Candidatus Syntrophoarchaeum sp.]|nr:hypothetical protein [Candidatus Syntrophoarchaeum sp.]